MRTKDRPWESESQKMCFVAMPFAKEFDDVFYYGIKPVVHARDLECLRVDKAAFVGNVVERIHELIDRADVVIADMTGSNPNVYYEVGYAHRTGKPVVLICADRSLLEFNLQSLRCLFYEDIHDLEIQLAQELDGLIGKTLLGQMR